ncbi:MAG: F0F1 ATP synthase subunit B [Candidatus Stahlbacteria bacterium]|nr:F0F1 ATP synthase subunit B [Candidatus Stahlbacteria bacterium]
MEGLGINLPLFVAQVINFVILLTLLYFIAYKPIIKMLDQRSDKIKEGMEQAEAIQQQLAHTNNEIKTQLDNSQKQAEAIIYQATKIGEQAKEDAKAEARREAEAMINKAKVEIEHEREKNIDELRKEFVDIAISAAEKVIKGTLDKEKHRQIIEDIIQETTTFQTEDNTPPADKKVS